MLFPERDVSIKARFFLTKIKLITKSHIVFRHRLVQLSINMWLFLDTAREVLVCTNIKYIVLFGLLPLFSCSKKNAFNDEWRLCTSASSHRL